MKGRVIVIDMPEDRASQAALIVDGRLEDLLLDPPRGDMTPNPGDIYRAKVDRLVPAIGGAFVKLTQDHQGFLREIKGIKQGAGVLVQTTSYAEPGKATPVTTRRLYKGRLVIHTPGAPGLNVSRQIKDAAERDRLTKAVDAALSELGAPSGGTDGWIVRSAALGCSLDDLRADIAQQWTDRLSTERTTDRSENAVFRVGSRDTALREWTETVPDLIAISAACADWVDQVTADNGDHPGLGLRGAVITDTFALQDSDPFDHFGVWDAIERLKSPRADLPSGGWMAIETTRAMVTVDVNTGDGFGTGDALTANIEAARELPRQLRLRGLGGQIAIDFAPLKKMHRRKIEEELKRAFRRDPVDTSLAGWTPLGHAELQRKRERRPLAQLLPD